MNDDSLIFLPDGQLNYPYLLSNANLLFKSREFKLAASLFELAKQDPNYAHSGYYGVGICLMEMGHPNRALVELERGLQLNKHPSIAVALLDALLACQEYEAAEEKALEFAITYPHDQEFVEIFRDRYVRVIGQ